VSDGGNFDVTINGVLITSDKCGYLGQSVPKRRTMTATVTAPFTGPYELEIYNFRATAPTDCWNYIDNISLAPVNTDLVVDTQNIKISTGGTAIMTLDAGTANAGADYLLLATYETYPGLNLDGVRINLSLDALFFFSQKNANSYIFKNTMGQLDAAGKATATFDTLGPVDPAWLGQHISFAYVLTSGPGTRPVTYGSLPVMVNFIP
jgi:hypothetical protein